MTTLIILGSLCCFSLILTRNNKSRFKKDVEVNIKRKSCVDEYREIIETRKLIASTLLKLKFNPEICNFNELQFESNGDFCRVLVFGLNVKFMMECISLSADSQILSSIKSAVNFTNVTTPSTIIYFDTNRNGKIVFHCIQEVDIYPLQDSSELLISKVIEALHITQHTFLQNIKTYQITTI